MLHTTFRLLKDAGACRGPYLMLARHLGGIGKYGVDTPIPFTVGLDEKFEWDDLLWALDDALPNDQRKECDRITRLVATDFICHVLPKLENANIRETGARDVIKIARVFVRGHATHKDLLRSLRRANVCFAPACINPISALDGAADQAVRECLDKPAERQWQRDRLRQYLDNPNKKPFPLPRKSRRKAA